MRIALLISLLCMLAAGPAAADKDDDDRGRWKKDKGRDGYTTIKSVSHNGNNIKAGHTLVVVMHGTPRGDATFELVGLSGSVRMQESGRGTYKGRLRLNQNWNIQNAPLVVRLTRNGQTATLQARHLVTVRPYGGTYAGGNNNGGAYNGAVQISSVHGSPNSLRGGETLTITMSGTPGGTAYADLMGGQGGIPLQETSPGHYVGYLQTLPQWALQNAALIGHLTRGSQRTQLQSSTLITVVPHSGYGYGGGELPLQITAPHSGQAVIGSFTVTGTTAPYAQITVRAVVRDAIIPGLLQVNGRTITATGVADANGWFAIPMHLSGADRNDTLRLTVTARNQTGQASREVRFDLAVGP